MREFPAFAVNPRLSETKQDALMRLWSDSACDARYAAGYGQHSWAARRYAENCRMLAQAFGTKLSPEARRQVRRSLDASRARLRERLRAATASEAAR